MGEEPFFIDRISKALETHVVEETARDFDTVVLYGKETQADQIIEAAKRFPMLGQRQLVVVREAQYLERNLEHLVSYFEHPQPQTVLVFCYKKKSLDKRTKVYKAISKNGVLFESKRIYDNQVGGWIETQAKEFGFRISPAAVALLTAFLGSNLDRIAREFEKLAILVPKGEEITPERIEKHIGFSKSFNVFELQKALGARQLSHAYRIVSYMANNASQYPMPLIIGGLFNFFQKLFLYHSLPSPSSAAKVLGVNPYFVKDYQAAAQKYNLRQAAKAMSVLKEIDLKSKGLGASNASHSSLLEELVLKIVSV